MYQKQEIRTRTSDLIELAILASRHGMAAEADTIRSALPLVAANSCLPQAVEALCLLYRGEYPRAVEILSDPTLERYPDVDLAKQYCALAYRLNGSPKRAEQIESELDRKPVDPDQNLE